MTDDLQIRHELRAGDLGRIITLHGECYDGLPGFGIAFEAFVGMTLAEYVLEAGARGRIWMAEKDGHLLGCTALVLRGNNLGQIRWVLVDPSARGIGLGKDLVQRALDWSRDMACTRIYLETTNGLPESQSLYEALGFGIVSNQPAELWDGVRPLIRMEMDL
jgi:N-acetylglutamate synthase-like GNAT family acetyltransferase